MALCEPSLSSEVIRAWRVSLSRGLASCLSRSFLMLPVMSDFRGLKAAEPRTYVVMVSWKLALKFEKA